MIMSIVTLVLGWLLKAFPSLGQIVVDYHAKSLDAANDAERIKTEQVKATLDAEAEQRRQDAAIIIAEQGNWLSRSIRPLFAFCPMIYCAKYFIFDKVCGGFAHVLNWQFGWSIPQSIFQTDPLSPDMTMVMMTIIVSYFGAHVATQFTKR